MFQLINNVNKSGVAIVSIFKKILLVIVALTTVILISVALYLAIGTGIYTGSDFVTIIKKDNKTLQISSMTSNSVLDYSGYSYKIKGDSLYLKLRYTIGSPLHHGGGLNITLNRDLKNIKCIYLQGYKVADKKLIWTGYIQNIKQNVLPVQMVPEKMNYKLSTALVKFEMTNKGNTFVICGQEYIIQKSRDGKWFDIPFKKNFDFTAGGFFLKANGKYEEEVLLSSSDFIFNAGVYRIIKVISTKNIKNINVSCNFNIN